ncbi:phosphatase, partial [Vibrio splendidus]
GGLDLVAALLDKVGVDSNKVVTHSPQQFLAFLALRGRQSIADFSVIE